MNILRRARFLIPSTKYFHTNHPKALNRLPNPWDLMTGLERWESVQYAKGNHDPYLLAPISKGDGTKDCPKIVYSYTDVRVVACVCSPDTSYIVYWLLYNGYPRRCRCNFWFALEKICAPPLYEQEECEP